MDSGTVGVNDNSDLNARERRRWGDNSKVYTRRNFRKKTQLETSNNVSATTATTSAAAAEPTSSTRGKDDLGTNENTLRSSSEETLDAAAATEPTVNAEPRKENTVLSSSEETLDTKDVNFSEQQPQPAPSRSEGEPSTSDVVRQPGEDSGCRETTLIGADEPPSHSVQEGQESVPNGGEEVPLSSDYEALPQTLPHGGQDTVSNGGEEVPLSSDDEALPQRFPHGGQDTVSNGGEELPLSSGHEALPQTPPHGGQDAVSNGGEELPLSSGHEALPQTPPHGGQDAVSNGGEELPLSSGHEALPQTLPNGGQDTVSNGGEEMQSQSRDGPESLSQLEPIVEQESLPDIREGSPIGDQSEVEMTEADLHANTGEEAATSAAKASEELQLTGGQVTVPRDEDSHAPGVGRPVNGVASAVNGLSKPVITRFEDRVRINISRSRSKDEMRKLKRKLENELDHVRNIVEKIETKELQLTAYNTSNVNTNSRYVGGSVGNVVGGYSQPQLVRANSELGVVGHQYSRPQLSRVNSEVGSVGYQEGRPFRHLSVSVMENNHGAGEFVEKEKRTPKANQFYRNSEFLLGKDRLPPESNKKLKLNCGGKKHGGNTEYGYGYGYQNRDKVLKSCSNLLQRLMKHKHAWVFNEPVDAKKLNIPDYYIIIKHPMDFGTIKTRLAQNWYKSAREFAEDVRLVFRNAMTYNPKGQDVHVMAEELSNIFEERWISIEKEYYPYQMYYDAGLPIPTPRKAPPPPVFAPVPVPIVAPIPAHPALPMRSLDRSESMTVPIDSRLKPSNSSIPYVGRTPVRKKPKAKDPNKRDMTYEEKQKLSSNLQSLPSEKLDAIVQIIKKRNSALSQHDDEIEVDIDSVDAETLWELDRFVTNYKKSLSKNKRKAELALQRKAEAAQAVLTTNPTPAVVEAQTENRTGEKNNPPVVEVEKQGDNVSGSSSSSSSSSDSGSSSSDSDSDSSSAYGSDAGHSPKT